MRDHNCRSSSISPRPPPWRSAAAHRRLRRPRSVALVGLLFLPSAALAIDTAEPFGAGASDVAVYVAGLGLGGGRDQAMLATSFELGYGVTEQVSAYLGGSASTDASFRGVDKSLRLGVFGTVLDTPIVDLDLFLDLRLAGVDLSVGGFAPGLEFSVALGRIGIFLTLWEIITVRAPAAPESSPSAGSGGALSSMLESALALGGLWSIAEGHEVLALVDLSLHPVPDGNQAAFEVGSVGLGYNVVLREGVELVNEVKLDLAGGAEQLALGFSTGVLVSMP
jgi:hypothetical protein